MVSIRNIVLYSSDQEVVGFVEFRITPKDTTCYIKHSINEPGLILSIVADGKSIVMPLGEGELSIKDKIDSNREIFVSIVRRYGEEVVALASGVVNLSNTRTPKFRPQVETTLTPAELKPIEATASIDGVRPQFQTVAAKEVDDLLREVCSFEQDGINACKKCPYREKFFEFGMEITN